MGRSNPDIGVRQIILVPALIALGVTLLRLVGELGDGSSALFSREPGGGGALVGIVWLVPIFGAYFSVKLVRGGHGPESPGRVVGFSLLGLLAAAAIMGLSVVVTGNPSVSVSLPGVVLQQLAFGAAAVVAVLIVRKVWPTLSRTLLGYAFASRLPVVIVMFLAMAAEWGTHYELGPPGYPEMGFLTKFILIAVMPQLTFWVMFTVVVGSFFGGIAASVLAAKSRVEESKALG